MHYTGIFLPKLILALLAEQHSTHTRTIFPLIIIDVLSQHNIMLVIFIEFNLIFPEQNPDVLIIFHFYKDL